MCLRNGCSFRGDNYVIKKFFSGEATLSIYGTPSEKESTLKGKNLLPMGANSFLLEWTHFQMGLGVLESKQEVTKVVSLVKMLENLQSISSPIKCDRFPIGF